jgi:uncharacterized protein (TIGR02145 family)
MKKKIRPLFCLVILIPFVIILAISCKKEETQIPAIIKDIDGNIYHTVTIGTQVWLKENLKVTHYRNGDNIPNITDSLMWGNTVTGACCNYNNDTSNCTIFGKLYNWRAVVDYRNICPIGWHVPNFNEWNTLIEYLGGDRIAPLKIKDTGTLFWKKYNPEVTNESGFSGLPGGFRSNFTNRFFSLGEEAYWWSSTNTGLFSAYSISIENNYGFDQIKWIDQFKEFGASVRCIKDN